MPSLDKSVAEIFDLRSFLSSDSRACFLLRRDAL